jgi:hypothetical protein
MDLVNWKKFCETYDLQYINNISKKGIVVLKKQLNKNAKFTGLKRILELHFNPSHKQLNTLNTCNIISPLQSLSYHISTKYNKYIYIFGENHYSKGTCNIKKECNIYDFIVGQISNIPGMIDVFLETPYIHKTGKYVIPSDDKGVLDKFALEFQGCLDIKKKCKYPNIRFHNTDVRDSQSIEKPFLSQLETYIILISYNIERNEFYDYKNHKKGLINLLTNKIYKKERDEYSKAIKSHDLIIKYLFQKYNKFKLEKQQEQISNVLKMILLQYFENAIFNIDLKNLQLDTILQTIKKLPINVPKKIPDYYSKLIDSILRLGIPLMDIYLIARMFRKFKNVKYQNSKEAKHIIIYVGNLHANNYREILRKLEFKTTFYGNSKSDEFCVNISRLNKPLFIESIN